MSEILKSERYVCQAVDAIEGYNDPFDLDDGNMYCLSSGCAIAEDVMADVLNVEKEGEKVKEEFIKERLGRGNEEKKGKHGEGIFFDPIKKLKLKTMATDNENVTLKKSSNEIVRYKQEGSFVFNILVQLEKMGTDQINLRDFMSYPLTPMPPYCICTSDGF